MIETVMKEVDLLLIIKMGVSYVRVDRPTAVKYMRGKVV